MLTLRPGSLAYRLISMLSVTGEYPIHSLHLLGNPRVMRDLVRRMSEPQLVRLPGADSVQTKLVQISGKGAAKSVRLYQRNSRIGRASRFGDGRQSEYYGQLAV